MDKVVLFCKIELLEHCLLVYFLANTGPNQEIRGKSRDMHTSRGASQTFSSARNFCVRQWQCVIAKVFAPFMMLRTSSYGRV